ncbi:MAG: hypothetical protein J6Z43_06410 [Clostridiales bacterium]|nr:hypothetical protein [Clostridiales bacterium]
MIAVLLILGFVVALVIALVLFIIYKLIYDHQMNKILASGNASGKRKWLAPWAFFLIVMGVMTVGYVGFAALFSIFTAAGRSMVETVYGGEPQMIDIEANDSVNYVVDGGYELIDEGTSEGIEYTLYKLQTKDFECRYIVIAHYAVEDPGMNEIQCEYRTEHGGMRASKGYYTGSSDPDLYFMIDVRDEGYQTGSIIVELTSGDNHSSLTFEV